MSKDTSKPKTDAAADNPTPREKLSNNLTGRVKHDDRGNAVWEWALANAKSSDDATTQGLKKLDNSNLSISEDAPPGMYSTKKNPLGTVKGYSPYDSGLLEKRAALRKKKDLRRLSEWMKLKKQAQGNHSDDE